MSKTEFSNRRSLFSQQLKDSSFALFESGKAPHKTTDQFYPFQVEKNFYYLTGIKRENFILLILKHNNSHFEYLFIEEPSDFATKWIGSKMTKEEASELSGIRQENIIYLKDFESFIGKVVMLDSRTSLTEIPKHLYLDLYRQHLMEEPKSMKTFKKIVKTYPELRIKDSNRITDEMRRLKSELEIVEVKKAISYTKVGIESLMKSVKAGMNERQMEARFEYEIKMAGADGTSFNTICASGKNATVLHYENNDQVIPEGALVLNDLGARSGEYGADITRTFPANGKFTERQKQYYNLVLSVNKTIIETIKPGVMSSDLNKLASDLLAEGLLKIGKIKDKSEISKYYYHGVGHYLGLDVHDVGTYKLPLEAGVLITVEPGIYIDDEGIGIRIEDNVYVTKDGAINLSKDIIKEVEEIEAFMKK